MRTISGRLLVLVFALLTIAPAAHSAETPADSPEQKVLDKWLGNWKATYKIPAADWNPVEKTVTAEVATTRVVGGRFVQELSEHSDKSSGMVMITYDSQQYRYRLWWFSSTGMTAEYRGKWDDDSQTMTWDAVGLVGATATMTSHFADDDHEEWNLTVKDAAGKTVLSMEGKNVRTTER
jgi:hypothetical protein